MQVARLTQAQAAVPDLLPDDLVVLGASTDDDLPVLPGLRVVTDDFAVSQAWASRAQVSRDCPAGDTVMVCVPRAKALAKAMVAAAAQSASTRVIVDGQKTDGIEGLFREVKKRLGDVSCVTKSHGRMFWFDVPADDVFADWRDLGPQKGDHGLFTQIGVFSADGVDPASALLIETLPPLKGAVADLGAGWGAISHAIAQSTDVKSLHLVEVDARALDCARMNVTTPAAVFHWADATTWMSPQLMDTVVMNPPFHAGRKGAPELGQAFIATAAKSLAPRGTLWMVANRHLPYEETLARHFGHVEELPGSGAFKLFQASRPRR